MSTFLSLLIPGLVIGSLYGLSGLAVVTTYKVTRVLNFAQASLATLATYCAMSAIDAIGMPLWVGLIVAAVVGTVGGVLVEWVAVRPMARGNNLSGVLATLGVSIVIDGVVQLVWGTQPKPMPDLVPGGAIHFLGATVTPGNLVTLALAVVIMIGLYVFFERTRIGLRVRATFQNRDAAELTGVDTRRVISMTWGLAGAVGAVAAVLVAAQSNLSPDLDASLLVYTLFAVAVGGFQSLPGAVIGGLVVGVFESLFAGYVNATYGDVVLLLILVLILVVFPNGLLGSRRRAVVRDSLALVSRRAQNIVFPRWLTALLLVVGAVIIIGIPFVLTDDLVLLLAEAAAYALVAISYVVVTGNAGLVTLGQGALAILGAYAAAVTATHWGWGFLPGLAAGAVVGLLAGVLVAGAMSRLSGFYLAIATTALVVGVPSLLISLPVSFAGGAEGLGIPPISLFGLAVTSTTGVFYLTAAIMVIGAVLTALLLRSGIGKRWQAVRDSPRGAAASGINVTLQRVAAFGYAGLLAAVGGVLFAYATSYITTDQFSFTPSVYIQFAAVVGGLQSVIGGIVGAVFVAVVPYLLSGQDAWGGIVFGLAGYLVLRLAPGGVTALARDLLVRAWPALNGAHRQPHSTGPAAGDPPGADQPPVAADDRAALSAGRSE
jgi:branched-chain amino acid transport system permease protein